MLMGWSAKVLGLIWKLVKVPDHCENIYNKCADVYNRPNTILLDLVMKTPRKLQLYKAHSWLYLLSVTFVS